MAYRRFVLPALSAATPATDATVQERRSDAVQCDRADRTWPRKSDAETVADVATVARAGAEHANDASDLGARADTLAEYLERLPRAAPERTYLRNCVAFIRDGWAAKAIWLGWSELELFGVHPAAPWLRFDCLGAALLARSVQAVTAESVVSEAASGSHLTSRRKPVHGEARILWHVLASGGGS